jgi:CRP-like cAMP-binding protein
MEKVYELLDIADSAYILHQGRLVFEISPHDNYSIEGREIIFGAEEPFLAHKHESDEYFRFQTAYVDESSTFDRIPLRNLFKVISIYNIGYAVTKNIARCLQITNRIYISREKSLSGVDMASKDFARIYVETIEKLIARHEQLQVKWLKQLIDRYTNSLVYMKGRAFLQSEGKADLKLDAEKLHEYTFDLHAGSILCDEGDTGHEMFILNRGNLEVLVGAKKVADINEPGTVIGEMALLLGERRTATLKTVTDCNITIIRPENLMNVARDNPDFFLNVAEKLAGGLEHNCMLIRQTDELLEESQSSDTPKPPAERTNYKELLKLVRELERYEVKYRHDWITKILNTARQEINKVRGAYS